MKLPFRYPQSTPHKGGRALFWPVLVAAVVFTLVLAAAGSGFFNQKEATLPVAAASPSAVSSPSSSAPAPLKSAEIAQAKAVNPDVAGWLTVPGTTLDMAVVHTGDNKFYLSHNLQKQYYIRGWPFLDYRDNPDAAGFSKNSIIYGHNRGDGTLFGQLKKYANLAFLNEHPVIYYGTGSEDCYWKIFAVYVTDVNLYYIQTDFTSDAEFSSFIEKMRAQSLYNTGVDVTAQDKILTLSTCTYEFGNARFAVQARLVRKGESLSVPAAIRNPSPASPHHAAG
jgi:sortase B